MNVGIVNQWYPTETGGGGVATYNVHLAQALKALGHGVVVLSSTGQKRSRTEIQAGIPVVRLPRPKISYRLDRRLPFLGRQMRSLRTWLYAGKVVQALPRIIDQYKLDILEYADAEAEALFHQGRIPLPHVVRFHGPMFLLEPYYKGKEQPFATGMIKWMERKTTLSADGWTSPTRFAADRVASAYNLPRSRIHVFQNPQGACCSWTVPRREHIVVLFVGRLEKRKGADTFAEAIPTVLAKMARTRFIYLAWDQPRPDGSSMKTYLMKKLETAGALGNVEFHTTLGMNGCIYERFKPDICVVPSRIEIEGYCVKEAMTHSIPVVASRTGGIPEIMNAPAEGFLVEPGNTAGFAEAIIRLSGDRVLRERMGHAGHVKFEREFDALKVSRRAAQIYEEVITQFKRKNGSLTR